MTAIASHLRTADLEARYETAADPVSKSHFHAIWLLSSGYTITEVAAILSFSVRWVRLLRKRYNEHGPDSLGDRRQGNGSAPAILAPEALSSLKERLKAPPDDGGLWTGPKVARWLASFHGLKSVHDQRGWPDFADLTGFWLWKVAFSARKPLQIKAGSSESGCGADLPRCRHSSFLTHSLACSYGRNSNQGRQGAPLLERG